MTTPPTFDKWPPIGPSYQCYQNGRGETMTRELVIEKYLSKYGELPAEVLFCKPFLWLAGPVPGPEAVVEDGAPLLLVGVPEMTETAPVLEGQTRFL